MIFDNFFTNTALQHCHALPLLLLLMSASPTGQTWVSSVHSAVLEANHNPVLGASFLTAWASLERTKCHDIRPPDYLYRYCDLFAISPVAHQPAVLKHHIESISSAQTLCALKHTVHSPQQPRVGLPGQWATALSCNGLWRVPCCSTGLHWAPPATRPSTHHIQPHQDLLQES